MPYRADDFKSAIAEAASVSSTNLAERKSLMEELLDTLSGPEARNFTCDHIDAIAQDYVNNNQPLHAALSWVIASKRVVEQGGLNVFLIVMFDSLAMRQFSGYLEGVLYHIEGAANTFDVLPEGVDLKQASDDVLIDLKCCLLEFQDMVTHGYAQPHLVEHFDQLGAIHMQINQLVEKEVLDYGRLSDYLFDYYSHSRELRDHSTFDSPLMRYFSLDMNLRFDYLSEVAKFFPVNDEDEQQVLDFKQRLQNLFFMLQQQVQLQFTIDSFAKLRAPFLEFFRQKIQGNVNRVFDVNDSVGVEALTAEVIKYAQDAMSVHAYLVVNARSSMEPHVEEEILGLNIRAVSVLKEYAQWRIDNFKIQHPTLAGDITLTPKGSALTNAVFGLGKMIDGLTPKTSRLTPTASNLFIDLNKDVSRGNHASYCFFASAPPAVKLNDSRAEHQAHAQNGLDPLCLPVDEDIDNEASNTADSSFSDEESQQGFKPMPKAFSDEALDAHSAQQFS